MNTLKSDDSTGFKGFKTRLENLENVNQEDVAG